MDLGEYLNTKSDGFIRILYSFQRDSLPIEIAFTDEVKPYIHESLKDWSEVKSLGDRLEKFGCRVKTWTEIEDEYITYEEITYIEIWRPTNRSLEELAQEFEAKEAIRKIKAEKFRAEHQKRLDEEEKRRQARILERQTIPEITDEMKAIEVNLGTLYVDQHPECPRFPSEVFLTSKVKTGTYSRAAYKKVLALDPLVTNTLRLYPYEDGEWPGIPGCRGAQLLRTMEVANKIADLAGWNVKFKPVRVLWREKWEQSFLKKKD